MENIFVCKDIEGLKSLIGANENLFVVVDSNLKRPELDSPLYHTFEGGTVIDVHASEGGKSIESVMEIIAELMQSGADRGAFVLGVGGGITTDMTGFAASIYKRGVKFAFVPTTLLAQVDASIGGKNGVNMESYKNIVGTITQPQWIYICTEVLRTLPRREFRAGVAEIIKTFILFDAEYYNIAVEYFTSLEERFSVTESYLVDGEFYNEDCLLDIIKRCVYYKCGVVERDEFEKGERRMLNLGHTFAHAIEKVCADSIEYEGIMHGEAVAIGMVLAAKMAAKHYGLLDEFVEKLEKDLQCIGLPVEVPCNRKCEKIPVEILLDALRKDKKMLGNSIHFILPKGIENVYDEVLPINVVEELADDLY